MKFRKTQSGETVLARVSCVVDGPLLRLMEEDYQPAGNCEKADWWQSGRGCIRYKRPEEINLGTTIIVSAIKIIRSYSEQEMRMIIIEASDQIEGLSERSPEHLAVRIAKFMGACQGVTDKIKSRWPDENGIL